MVLSISYDLNKPGQKYGDLYEAIKSCGTWWHYLDSSWLLDTTYTPAQVWEKLSKHLDKNDHLLIIRVTNNPQFSGWLPEKAWEWLRSRTY